MASGKNDGTMAMRAHSGFFVALVIVILFLPIATGYPVAHGDTDCSDPEALHQALLEHDKVRIAFRYKMQTGYRRSAKRGDLAIASMRNEILYSGAGPTIKAIQDHLVALDRKRRTATLIYEPGEGTCVWLIGPDKMEAGKLRSSDFVANRFRKAFAVAARMADRMPKKRGAVPIHAATDRPGPEADSRPEVPEGLVDEVLPRNIQDEILRFETLLILPSRDLSAVPFAALQVSPLGQPLIESVLPIMLPTVDALFFWVKAPTRFAGMSSVVIGDPDLTEDPSLDFVPLPGGAKRGSIRGNITRDTSADGPRGSI